MDDRAPGTPAAAGDASGEASAFLRVAGAAAVGAGISGFLYSVSFIGLVLSGAAPEPGALVSSLALLLGAVLSIVAFGGLYRLLLETDAGFALLTLLLGATGAMGAAIHGGYDLALAIHPPAGELGAVADLPNPIDPRGLLTFGVSGLAVLLASWLIRRSGLLPRGIGLLGYLAGALLLVIYLGRLIILTPTHPLVAAPAAVAGFLVSPAWYIWLGVALRRVRARIA